MLNTYSHGGPKNWSVELRFENGRITSAGGSDFGGGDDVGAVVFDEWVELRIEIDLDANTQSIFYGGALIDTTPWHASGQLAIEAVDLFSNNGSPVYFDDLSLEEVVPTTNVGPRGIAQHTSQLGGFGANLAINGNLGDFTHTAAGNGGLGAAVWELDLGESLPLRELVVHNRSSCCGSRLRDIVVSIHDAPYLENGAIVGDPIGGDGVWDGALFQSGLLNPENELGAMTINEGPANLPVDLIALTGAPVSGRYIRVARLADDDLSGSGGEGNADEGTVLSLGEVQAFVETALLPVSILTQPQGATVAQGSCHRFTVSLFNADNADSISYQWRKDGVDLAGETGDNLFITDLTADDAGLYSVVVDADGELVTSDDAELVVTAPNLALGGTASQIDTGFGGTADRAIDGNTSGAFGSGSITHTNSTEGAWWEVELAAVSTIDEIVVWNRTECCSNRLMNIRVSVLDEAREETYGEDFFTDVAGDPPVPNFAADAGGVEGLYVRIERLGPDSEGNNFVSLSEVQVFGSGPPVPPDPNLARTCGAVATQSSQLGGFAPGLAIDGNLGNFTHTQGGDDMASWELVLPEEVEMGTIVVHNRSSCCGSRLRDITVEVLDAAGDVLYTSPLLNPENELGAFPNGPASLRVDLQFGDAGVLVGNTVRITRTADPDLSGTGGEGNADESNVLSLGEVEIFGPIDCGGTGNTVCDGVTVEGPKGDKPGVYAVTVNAMDPDGDDLVYSLSANDGNGGVVNLGPQAENVFNVRLGLGSWEIAVSADDSDICPTETKDATCVTMVDVVCDAGNLAPFGVASQSTEGFGGAASRAIDCNTDGVYPNGSVTHTATDDPAPSWEVDLLDAFPIERVVIWGRSDCCSDRLTNFRVSILDAKGAEVFGEDFFTDGSFPDPAMGFEVATDDVVGNVVRISRLGAPEDFPGQFFLSLAEVEVYEGTAIPTAGPFLRGDSNLDGQVDISDPTFTLNWLFLGGPMPGCMANADTSQDGAIDISDPTFVLNHLFLGGPAIPAPYPECGLSEDPRDVELGCESADDSCI